MNAEQFLEAVSDYHAMGDTRMLDRLPVEAERLQMWFSPDSLDRAALIKEWRMCDSGDSWGDCMSAWFDVAGELYMRGEPIPDEWKYRPGISARNADSYFALACAHATNDALHGFGALLTRYARMLRAAGKDY